MRDKRTPSFNLFEPTRVFIAILIVAILWLAPIVFPQWETKPGEPEVKSLTVLSVVSANPPDVCSDECKVWYCAEKIPGGGCLEWTFHCAGCDGGGGGGGPVYQPPTISHVLNCSVPGNNSWCIGTLSLDLTASDPQGQSVIISGDVNGTTFACPSGQTTCSIPLSEGTGTANYKVNSATGLSATGSTTYQLDVTTPEISWNVIGTFGLNGWHVSPPPPLTATLVTASASDALSSLLSFEVSVDNAGWVSYSNTTFMDGMHTIQFRATDNAGNVTETAVQSVNVDTVAPTLNVSTTGTTGSNGWYVSAVTLTPTTSDATSGLATLEVTTDGATWSSVSGPITLNDGIYTVQFRATDQAGNISETTAQQIKVDATTPSLSLNINGTRGQNDWYISSVTVTPNASDAGSGVAKIEASVDSGSWGMVSSPLSFSDGTHTYSIRVTDNAGNVTETSVLPLMVDTVPPAIATSDNTLDLGDILNYDLEDTMSGLWINRSVIEDEDEKYKKIVWLEELTGKKSNDNEIRWDGVFADGTHAAPGQYFITLKISDQAGNETMQTTVVEVNAFNSLLPIPAFTPPANMVTEPAPSGSSTTNEPSFGGANNGNVGTETTTTNGETVFASANLQAGGTSSFTVGNQTTSTPISNPNILWGAAAAAVLGATLADWQKKREEEAARLAAMRNSGGGGGDEGEGSSKKKSPGRIAYEKKMQQKHIIGELQAAAKTSQAKPVNQLAKIDTDEERLEAYKQTAGYQARQQSYAEYERQKAMEAQRAGERNASDRSKPKAAEGRIEKERQYDLTSWMPLVINRNLESPELADMRFYNVLMQPGNLPTVKTYPSSAFGPWITELLGNFRTLNTGGGKWDIKLEMQKEFRSGLGDKDAAHILCSNSGTCKWVDYSTAGNILYGTTAADVGVPREMSKLAGGLLEVWEGTAKWENRSNWFEDPNDTNAVNFGYDLYESTGGNITEEAFRNALTDDFLNSLQPPSEGFEPPFEARPQPNTYPADRFDHQPEGQ